MILDSILLCDFFFNILFSAFYFIYFDLIQLDSIASSLFSIQLYLIESSLFSIQFC